MEELEANLELKLFTDEYLDNPRPLYGQIRKSGPLVLSESFPPNRYWLVNGHGAASEIIKGHRTFGKAGYWDLIEAQMGAEAHAPIKTLRSWMSQLDPPDHTAVRAAFAQTFTPKAIRGMTPIIEQIVDTALSGLAHEPVDIMPTLAYEVPILVICEILGVPGSDRGKFMTWSANLVKIFDSSTTPEGLRASGVAIMEFSQYLSELIDRKVKSPTADITSALVADVDSFGSDAGRDALIANLMLMVWAGHETTMNLIGNGLLAFARHPDAVSALQTEPGLMANAVEEVLRYEGPIRTTSRIALSDARIGDHTIVEGEMVVVLQQAANCDPSVFPDGDRFDVYRDNAKLHLGFGGGIHFCLGAALARAEASIVFRDYFRRFGTPQLAAQPQWNRSLFIRGLESLTLDVGAEVRTKNGAS